MPRSILVSAVASIVLGSAVVARAEVKTIVEHNVGDKATADFKFKDVPAASKDGSAAKATVTLVDGEKDDNAADAGRVVKGALPTEEDAPDANFFFAAGSDGGRLQIDLGSAAAVKQVNTYSWHRDTRGPQVYKLYAADGKAAKFDPKPKHGVDPTTVGWTLLASVDTRPKAGDPGGQYGVCTKDSADAALGTFRYVLIDASKTEADDDFGNTFFSRIDVVTAK